MRDLIGERPSVVPSGLGNGNSDMDMSVFTDGPAATSDRNQEEVEVEEVEAGSPTRWGMVNGDESLPSGDDEGGSEDGGGLGPDNRPGKNNKVAKLGRTGAKPGSSRPVTRPVKENKRKRKADDFSDIAEAEELTRQRQLELAKAKVEAKQATKQAEYAYKMQKMLDRKERRKERIQERVEKMHMLQLRAERGMGTGLPNGTGSGMPGMHTITSSSSFPSHSPRTPSVRASLSNQDLSNMFPGALTSGSYYHMNSPIPPVTTLSSGMDEFGFANEQTLSSYSSGGTTPGPSSEHTTEQMGSPSSSSMYGSYSGA